MKSKNDISIACNYDGFVIHVRFDNVTKNEVLYWEKSPMFVANFYKNNDIFGFVFNIELLFDKPPFVLYEPHMDDNFNILVKGFKKDNLYVNFILVNEYNIIEGLRKVKLNTIHSEGLIDF